MGGGLFCGGGKGRLQRDSDLGCTREIGSVPDFFEGFVKIAPAAAVWMHLIFPISWSSDWGQPYSGDHSDSSQLNPCALALSAFSCCSSLSVVFSSEMARSKSALLVKFKVLAQ